MSSKDVFFQVDTTSGPTTVIFPLSLGRSMGRVLLAIGEERLRQDALVRAGKFPWNCAFDGPSYAEKLAVLMEEVGEVSREVVEHLITEGKYAADEKLRVMPPHREEYFRERLREELVQVAACCVAWCEHLQGSGSAAQAELEAKAATAAEAMATCPRCNGTKECGPWGDSDRDSDERTPCNFCHRTGLVSASVAERYTRDQIRTLAGFVPNPHGTSKGGSL